MSRLVQVMSLDLSMVNSREEPKHPKRIKKNTWALNIRSSKFSTLKLKLTDYKS